LVLWSELNVGINVWYTGHFAHGENGYLQPVANRLDSNGAASSSYSPAVCLLDRLMSPWRYRLDNAIMFYNF